VRNNDLASLTVTNNQFQPPGSRRRYGSATAAQLSQNSAS